MWGKNIRIQLGLQQYLKLTNYNVHEISVCARGEFQSKTNVFHGFTTVQYS